MSEAVPQPFDVRLMNLTATLLFAACTVLAASALIWWAGRHSAFSIDGIAIEGDLVHTDATVLRSTVAPHLSGNFFTVDLGATRAAFESVPWVRRAVVSREFPDRLRVSLREQRAAAFWNDAAGSKLVNELGEVFEANTGDVEQDNLPRLVGPAVQSAHLLDMYRALDPLFEPLGQSVDEVELTARGGWRVQLDSGSEIELGDGTIADVVDRTERFVRTIANVVAVHERDVDAIESADLRYPDGYALRLRGVTTGVEPAAAPKSRPKKKALKGAEHRRTASPRD